MQVNLQASRWCLQLTVCYKGSSRVYAKSPLTRKSTQLLQTMLLCWGTSLGGNRYYWPLSQAVGLEPTFLHSQETVGLSTLPWTRKPVRILSKKSHVVYFQSTRLPWTIKLAAPAKTMPLRQMFSFSSSMKGSPSSLSMARVHTILISWFWLWGLLPHSRHNIPVTGLRLPNASRCCHC